MAVLARPDSASRPLRLARGPWSRRLVSLAGVLAVWQAAVWVNSAAGFMNPALLPRPAGVLQAASEQIAEGFLHLDILYRVIAGFLLGAALALGCVAGSVQVIEDLLDPVLELLRPIPPLAWLPLFLAKMSARHGVDRSRLQVVNLQPPDLAPAFARGDIDAALIWEPHLTRTARQGGTVVLTGAQASFPDKRETYRLWGLPIVIFAPQEFIDRHPNALVAFLRGLTRGHDVLMEHRAEALEDGQHRRIAAGRQADPQGAEGGRLHGQRAHEEGARRVGDGAVRPAAGSRSWLGHRSGRRRA